MVGSLGPLRHQRRDVSPHDRADGPRALPLVVVLRALADRCHDARRRGGRVTQEELDRRAGGHFPLSRPDRGVLPDDLTARTDAALSRRRRRPRTRVASAGAHPRAALRAGQARDDRADRRRGERARHRGARRRVRHRPALLGALHVPRALGRRRRRRRGRARRPVRAVPARRRDEADHHHPEELAPVEAPHRGHRGGARREGDPRRRCGRRDRRALRGQPRAR